MSRRCARSSRRPPLLGDERTREIARSLAAAVEPAVQLALVAALSAAADEITAALLDSADSPDGVGASRRRRRPLRRDRTQRPPTPGGRRRPTTRDATARISLRLSEALKSDIDAAARRDGVSVNTWLVRAASSVLSLGGTARPGRTTTGGAAQRITGWING